MPWVMKIVIQIWRPFYKILSGSLVSCVIVGSILKINIASGGEWWIIIIKLYIFFDYVIYVYYV